jgi:hypothetical protein
VFQYTPAIAASGTQSDPVSAIEDITYVAVTMPGAGGDTAPYMQSASVKYDTCHAPVAVAPDMSGENVACAYRGVDDGGVCDAGSTGMHTPVAVPVTPTRSWHVSSRNSTRTTYITTDDGGGCGGISPPSEVGLDCTVGPPANGVITVAVVGRDMNVVGCTEGVVPTFVPPLACAKMRGRATAVVTNARIIA